MATSLIAATSPLMVAAKVLFFDVDGVMNSTRSAIGLRGVGHFPREAVKDHHQRNDAALLRSLAMWDPVALGILQRIIEETQCKIVVSSVWRMGVTVEDFNHLFLAHDLPPVIIGKTAVTDAGFRGREVRMWLAQYRERFGIKDYLILDDDSYFFKYQKGRFVKINGEVGLDYPAYRFITERWAKRRKLKRSPDRILRWSSTGLVDDAEAS